ncbi:MAG: cell division topological specificity factor MinE [Candidatus Eremiobacteraeota bacterium]|nr:cell division topological specificity factor MinE [Candidatus Eremiobacteraeota bacterium]MBV8366990.1 cell division topological specificity factor MinE [Candidatus Eremiobacteraeota bacterium]
MIDFITKFFRREEASRVQAKERLRLVLMSDRVSLAPDVFDSMKSEMLGVVRRYLDIDEHGLDVHFENAERQFMLLANIPVLKVRPVVAEGNGMMAAAVGARGTNGAHGASQTFALESQGNATRPRRRRRRRKHHQTEAAQDQNQAPPDNPAPQ